MGLRAVLSGAGGLTACVSDSEAPGLGPSNYPNASDLRDRVECVSDVFLNE